MRIILTLVLISICLSVFSQDKLIVLHPVIGDTIDKQEQRDFVLFSDIIKQDFTFATIHCENEKYVMHINSTLGLIIVNIKEEDVLENSKHVDKLVRYFKILDEKKDSLNINLRTAESWPKFQLELLNEAQKIKIAKEARKYFNLNQDAVQLGLSGLDKENYIKVNSKSWLAETLFEILK
jgi:hypothetical protein